MTTPARAALDWVLAEQPPSEADVEARFSAAFLAQVPALTIQGLLVSVVGQLREDLPDLSLLSAQEHALTAVVAQTEIHVAVEPEAPHRICGLLFKPATAKVDDARLSDPPTSMEGSVGAAVSAVAASAWQDRSLVGLAVAVQDRGQLSTATVGWADLAADRAVVAVDVLSLIHI